MSVIRFAHTQVTSVEDPRIKDYVALTDVSLRRLKEPAEGLFMAESLPVIQRAHASGYAVRSILTEPKWLDRVAEIDGLATSTPIYVAEPQILQQITGYRLHRGLLAAMDRRPDVDPQTIIAHAARILVLHGLVDHTNVGAAFRSGAAMGVDVVLVSSECADPLYRRSVRVSMGAVFQVPWARVPEKDLPGVLSEVTTIALTPGERAEDLEDLLRRSAGPTALMVGSEGPGLPASAMAWADHLGRIPMGGGVDSLNVAAAVAVACYAQSRVDRERGS